jgi:hypothetical protein
MEIGPFHTRQPCRLNNTVSRVSHSGRHVGSRELSSPLTSLSRKEDGMAESPVHKQEKSDTQVPRTVGVCGDRGGTDATQQPPVGPDPNYDGGTTRGGDGPGSSDS